MMTLLCGVLHWRSQQQALRWRFNGGQTRIAINDSRFEFTHDSGGAFLGDCMPPRHVSHGRRLLGFQYMVLVPLDPQCNSRLWLLIAPMLGLAAIVAAYPCLLFVVFGVRCLRRVRAAGCPKCGYNLTGNTSGVCPECGAEVHEAESVDPHRDEP
jgi:hypothetical protein